MTKIQNIQAREILDSRGNPTVEVDVTLASGKCYPVLNLPVGEIYTKPSMDEEWVETIKRKNLETRGANKVIAFSAPEAWRIRTCRVAYHT